MIDPKISEWLNNQKIDLSMSYSFDVGNKQVLVSLKELLEGTIERMVHQSLLLTRFQDIKKYYLSDRYYSKERDPESATNGEAISFLKDMGCHVAYKNHHDYSWKELSISYGMSKDFLKWWAEEKGFSERQMRCDHDDTDQYSEDGQWYNSVGVCKKCLAHTGEDEDLELVYKAWNRKK